MKQQNALPEARGVAVTEELAAYIAAARFADLPAAVVQMSKNSILDTIGVALAGAVEPGARLLGEHVAENEGTGACSLIGLKARNSPRSAALVNGMSAHMLGYSDLSVTPVVHPSISVVPAVLALAQARGASGRDVILAHVLGVELACKLGEAVGAEFNQKGWHPCSVLGTFGAVAGAARIAGLDASRTANAMGLAGMQAAGIKAGMGTMAKAYGAGKAAESGVVSTVLAEKGFTGPTSVIEGVDGFLQTFGDGASGDHIVESFGNPYHFVAPGIAYKPYPSCTCSHTSIKAVLSLREQHAFQAEEVAEIVCSVSPAVANYLKFPQPATALEAKYSLQYCVAAALLDGTVDINTFNDARVSDPRVVKVMRRIKMTVAPDLAALGFNPAIAPFGARVTVRLRDGREFFRRQDKGPWEPETPPSWNDLLQKYQSCAALVLNEAAIAETISILANLENERDVSRLMELLEG